jgi:hypothetical protein
VPPVAWAQRQPACGGRVQRWAGDGQEALRFVVVHASQLVQQQTQASTAAKSKQGQARWFAWEADAEAASAEYDGRDAEAATHAPGGIRQSTIVSWQKPGARAARGGDVQQRWTSHRLSRAIARWWQWRPSPTRRRTMGGRSWPRPCALR